MEYIILIAVVLVFGLGVVLWSRSRRPAEATHEVQATAVPATLPDGGAAEEAPESGGAATVVEPDVQEVAEAPTFRSRMAKARGALTGALAVLADRVVAGCSGCVLCSSVELQASSAAAVFRILNGMWCRWRIHWSR